MIGDRGSKMDSSLPDRLFAAFAEAAMENDSVVREELAALNIDHDQVVDDGLRLVKNLLGQQKQAQAQEALRRIKAAIQDLGQYASTRSEATRQKIAQTLAGDGNDQLCLVYFRKLETIEPEDLASLEDEKKLLKLLHYLQEPEE